MNKSSKHVKLKITLCPNIYKKGTPLSENDTTGPTRIYGVEFAKTEPEGFTTHIPTLGGVDRSQY